MQIMSKLEILYLALYRQLEHYSEATARKLNEPTELNKMLQEKEQRRIDFLEREILAEELADLERMNEVQNELTQYIINIKEGLRE